jgi:hypothetical protein
MILKHSETAAAHETFWVIGGGQFGRRAVELLKKDAPAGKIVVVDIIPIRNLPDGIEMICADGIEWLTEHFTPDAAVDKIIPALPVHLAADWLKKKLIDDHKTVRSTEIPDDHLRHFPHPMRISPSRVVISLADFLCPPNCSEPANLCTYTGKKRPPSLYRTLETIVAGNFVPLIVRSRQFDSGVGGFFPDDLWHLLEQARLLPETPLLIGTACKCHGVVDGLDHSIS